MSEILGEQVSRRRSAATLVGFQARKQFEVPDDAALIDRISLE